MNRLHLDFSLNTDKERAEFVNIYIQKKEFAEAPLTAAELSTIADYILWGKNPKSGKNVKQEKMIELESRSKIWDSKEVESLDALIETPTFLESQIRPINGPKYKNKKITFSREETRKTAPTYLLETFENLWNEIDRIDLLINYYDLAHNKRKNPPRTELLKLFTEEEQEKLQAQVPHINQYKYLKLRHTLVELRREQFTLRDTYSPVLQVQGVPLLENAPTPTFAADITVLPFGIKTNTNFNEKIFNPERFPIPKDFNADELKKISNLLWQKDDSPVFFDFRNVEHLYNLFLMFYELQDSVEEVDHESTLIDFIETVKFYAARAELSNVHSDVLKYKILKWRNQDIADAVNRDYSKTYNANYISTIFKQKVLPQIAGAASQHREVLENIFFPENFKKCRDCGKVLLINTTNFIRKSKSKDGFSSRCKKCDKIQRMRREEK